MDRPRATPQRRGGPRSAACPFPAPARTPLCRRRRRRTTALRLPSGLWVEQNRVREKSRLELHLIHLELLRDRHGIGAVEARAAKLLGRAATDRPHQAWNGQVRQAVGADVLAHLVDSPAGRDQFLSRADVDAHEAWETQRRAPAPHLLFSPAYT